MKNYLFLLKKISINNPEVFYVAITNFIKQNLFHYSNDLLSMINCESHQFIF